MVEHKKPLPVLTPSQMVLVDFDELEQHVAIRYAEELEEELDEAECALEEVREELSDARKEIEKEQAQAAAFERQLLELQS